MMGTPPSGETNKRPRPPDAFHGAFVPSDAPPASLVRQFAGGPGGVEELKRELYHCGQLLEEERRQRQTADNLAQERGRELQEARAVQRLLVCGGRSFSSQLLYESATSLDVSTVRGSTLMLALLVVVIT